MSDVCFRLGGMTEDRRKKVHLVNNVKNGRTESGTVVTSPRGKVVCL